MVETVNINLNDKFVFFFGFFFKKKKRGEELTLWVVVGAGLDGDMDY